MKGPFTIGAVGHFGVAVRDPRRSATWFVRVLGLRGELATFVWGAGSLEQFL